MKTRNPQILQITQIVRAAGVQMATHQIDASQPSQCLLRNLRKLRRTSSQEKLWTS